MSLELMIYLIELAGKLEFALPILLLISIFFVGGTLTAFSDGLLKSTTYKEAFGVSRRTAVAIPVIIFVLYLAMPTKNTLTVVAGVNFAKNSEMVQAGAKRAGVIGDKLLKKLEKYLEEGR